MPTNVRFTKFEETLIRDKCISLNKSLVNFDKLGMRESVLIHILIQSLIDDIKVDNQGNLHIKVNKILNEKYE